MTEGDFSPLALLHQQLALECKGVDSSGRLFRLPGEDPEELPLVFSALCLATEGTWPTSVPD